MELLALGFEYKETLTLDIGMGTRTDFNRVEFVDRSHLL